MSDEIKTRRPLLGALAMAGFVVIVIAGLHLVVRFTASSSLPLDFESPRLGAILALIILPLVLHVYLAEAFRRKPTLVFSSLKRLGSIRRGQRTRWRHLSVTLRLVGLALLIGALARPRSVHRFEEITTHGVDIALMIDVSGSMRAQDFKPHNRLHVAKAEVKRFVLGRKHDRIGLVVFAGYSFTQCPLTLDYDVLLKFVNRLHVGIVRTDGTNIGMAIATALNRLRQSKTKSKVAVLLTDGAHNVPGLDPLDAARLAQAIGVRIYTVGVGRDSVAPFAKYDPFFGRRLIWQQAELNEEVLQEIAKITGGRYFRARDEEGLAETFRRIDKLEKSEIKAKQYTRYGELAGWLLLLAFGLLIAEAVLRSTLLRRIP